MLRWLYSHFVLLQTFWCSNCVFSQCCVRPSCCRRRFNYLHILVVHHKCIRAVRECVGWRRSMRMQKVQSQFSSAGHRLFNTPQPPVIIICNHNVAFDARKVEWLLKWAHPFSPAFWVRWKGPDISEYRELSLLTGISSPGVQLHVSTCNWWLDHLHRTLSHTALIHLWWTTRMC